MISVLLPTTGRPELAEACVRGLAETTAEHDIEILAAVDCDQETADRLLALNLGQRVTLIVDHQDEYRGCSRAWNDALAASKGDPVVFAADDLTWTPGWLDAALEQLAAFPDGWGLVGFNDGHWDHSLSTHYLMSRRFIVEVLGGVVAWEFYEHSFNDLEVNERAKAAGRYAWCANARVLHAHWIFGDRPQDATDTRKLAAHPDSQRMYTERAAAGFPNDNVKPVIS